MTLKSGKQLGCVTRSYRSEAVNGYWQNFNQNKAHAVRCISRTDKGNPSPCRGFACQLFHIQYGCLIQTYLYHVKNEGLH